MKDQDARPSGRHIPETGPRKIGTIVRDGNGAQWIRLAHGTTAWWLLDEFGGTGVSGRPVAWGEIPTPVADEDWWLASAQATRTAGGDDAHPRASSP